MSQKNTHFYQKTPGGGESACALEIAVTTLRAAAAFGPILTTSAAPSPDRGDHSPLGYLHPDDMPQAVITFGIGPDVSFELAFSMESSIDGDWIFGSVRKPPCLHPEGAVECLPAWELTWLLAAFIVMRRLRKDESKVIYDAYCESGALEALDVARGGYDFEFWIISLTLEENPIIGEVTELVLTREAVGGNPYLTEAEAENVQAHA